MPPLLGGGTRESLLGRILRYHVGTRNNRAQSHARTPRQHRGMCVRVCTLQYGTLTLNARARARACMCVSVCVLVGADDGQRTSTPAISWARQKNPTSSVSLKASRSRPQRVTPVTPGWKSREGGGGGDLLVTICKGCLVAWPGLAVLDAENAFQ